MKKLLIIILITISSSAFSQQGKFVFEFNNFKIFKEPNEETYQILDSENNVMIKNLKYVNYVNGYNLQALDKNNTIIYLDEQLNKMDEPKDYLFRECGTLSFSKRKIIKDRKNYYVQLKWGYDFHNKGGETSITDTIPRKGIKDIYFVDLSKEVEISELSYIPTYVILDLGDKFAIKDNESIQYFDSIDLKNPSAIKVKIKDAIGYYNATKVKYKELGEFQYNLASFIDLEGNTGYVDRHGNEYLNPLSE